MILDISGKSDRKPGSWLGWFFLVIAAMLFSGCSQVGKYIPGEPDKPKVKTGKPYTIFGKRYYPLKSSEGFEEEGVASWYGKKFHKRPTANGEVFDMYSISAAHKTLPLPTWVRVTNLDNRRSMVLRINDRGPFVGDRIIDLSYAAAKVLGFEHSGTAHVRVKVLSKGEQKKLEASPKRKKRRSRKNVKAISRPMVTSESIGEAGNGVFDPSAKPKKKKGKIAKKLTKGEWSSGRAYVQAGSFAEFGNAKKLAQRLATVGKTRVQSKKVGLKTFYRVMLGPFTSKIRADNAVKRLKNMGIVTTQLVLR
jgi:rare lipoprotein A